MEISTSSGTSTTSCTLLDQPVGFKCLASLLGVGGARLGKKAAGNPDLRFGKHGHHSKPGTWTVDGFLQVAYDAVAETLPDEFLRYPIVILLDYVQTILYHIVIINNVFLGFTTKRTDSSFCVPWGSP